jgi:transcriptional regulator with XRE-family HTH domain
MDFRTLVLEWLERRGWSRAQLAEAAGVSQSLLSKWLHDEPHPRRVRPGPESLRKLAPILGHSYADLLRTAGYLEDDVPLERDVFQTLIRARVQQLLTEALSGPDELWMKRFNRAMNRAVEEIRDTNLHFAELEQQWSERAGNTPALVAP